MKIKDLKEPYKEMALINQERQGNKRDEEIDLERTNDFGSFDWNKTEEGFEFWSDVYRCKLPEIKN